MKFLKTLGIILGTLVLGVPLVAGATTTLYPQGGGTGTTTPGGAGSVEYSNGTILTNNNNLFFDSTNNRLGISSSSPTSPLTIGNGGTVAIPTIEIGTTGNQGLYQAGTNSLGMEAAGAGFQWNGTALTPNISNKTIGSFTNPWRKLYFGDPSGGWYLSTSTSNAGTALLTSGGYPSLFVGADDSAPIANIELNDLNEGPYGSFGIKVNNGGGTFTAALVLDTNDTIAGIPQYLALDNQTGAATCLQITDGGVTCLSDYNGLSSLLDTISPGYSSSGTESGMTTTLQQVAGNDAIDYGLQNYPGAFATGLDAYQNYYSSTYAQGLPEPHFSFWEQANGATSEASTSWGFLGATTTVSGANATTTSVDIGDLGNTTMFRSLLSPSNATLNVISSSTKTTDFTVQKNTNGTLAQVFAVKNNGDIVTSGTAPAVTACGTATIYATSTDMRGTIKVTAGTPTTCNMTFSSAKTDTPTCVASGPSAALGEVGINLASTTGVQFGLLASFSGNIQYICMQ